LQAAARPFPRFSTLHAAANWAFELDDLCQIPAVTLLDTQALTPEAFVRRELALFMPAATPAHTVAVAWARPLWAWAATQTQAATFSVAALASPAAALRRGDGAALAALFDTAPAQLSVTAAA